jgi:hypothetical protein
VIEQNPIGKKAFGKKKNALERCNKKGCWRDRVEKDGSLVIRRDGLKGLMNPPKKIIIHIYVYIHENGRYPIQLLCNKISFTLYKNNIRYSAGENNTHLPYVFVPLRFPSTRLSSLSNFFD